MRATLYTRREHPRVCGENGGDYGYGATAEGTSPRTRGKRAIGFTLEVAKRNIPAYAGKTSGAGGADDQAAEHPRVRGENQLGRFRMLKQHGTSPRTRGKR